jgi:hypothetical protein
VVHQVITAVQIAKVGDLTLDNDGKLVDTFIKFIFKTLDKDTFRKDIEAPEVGQ